MGVAVGGEVLPPAEAAAAGLALQGRGRGRGAGGGGLVLLRLVAEEVLAGGEACAGLSIFGSEILQLFRYLLKKRIITYDGIVAGKTARMKWTE